MSKIAVLMLLAGIAFGSTMTMYGMASKIDEADAYASQLWKEAKKAKEENHLLKIQLQTAKEEIRTVADMIPPNATQCWRQYRKVASK